LIVLIPYVHQIQRSRMSGPLGLCSARAPENRRRAVALAGIARNERASLISTKQLLN
jgi:hypothetical protein